MDLDFASAIGRQLHLGRLQERRRHAEAEPPLKGVVGAAGENGGAGAQRLTIREGHLDRIGGAIERGDTASFRDDRAGQDGAPRQLRIERHAIDHDRFGRRRRVFERVTGGCDEPDGRQRIEHRFSRHLHRIDHIRGEHAGAMHGGADLIVLLEHGHRPSAGREGARGGHPARPAADDHDIDHAGRLYRPVAATAAQSLRPRSSQRPRSVIQNDWSTRRRSRHRPARR